MGKRHLLAVLAGTLVASGVAVAPRVAAEPLGVTPVEWRSCADAPEVDCATIEVPVDWADPRGPKVHIGLARREATDPDRRIGSVLVNPGGPGGSGVAMVKNGEPFTDEVNARFDRVGFDPRGVGTSSPLLCDGDLAGRAAAARRPTSQAEFDELTRLNRALHDSCRESSGPLARHVDNLHTVRDLDAIRAAVGDRKLTFVGYSYGSLMGQQYAELFPHRIRALVMDGNMDHSLRTAWDYAGGVTAAAEQAFVEFAHWCDTTPTCALYGQDTKAVYADLKARARAGTLVDQYGRPMDFSTLSGNAFVAVVPLAWSALGNHLKQLRDGAGGPMPRVLAELVNEPLPLIWCSDWRWTVRDHAEYARMRARLAEEFPNIEWVQRVDYTMACVGSGTRTTNPQRPLDIDHAPPLVMVAGLHDPATVYEWNLTAARQSGAHLITYEGWGHTVYGGDGPSECVNDAVDAYLIELRPPERGLRCPSTDHPAAPQGG